VVEHIVGRALAQQQPAAPGAAGAAGHTGSAGHTGGAGHPGGAVNTGGVAGEVVLELRGLAGGPLRGVDLRLRRGEVLGIAGLLGSGRTELLQTVFGARPAGAGEMLLHGRPVRFGSPGEAMAAGVAHVPRTGPPRVCSRR
jgi:ABC-type sugar transport system ATPase subunit